MTKKDDVLASALAKAKALQPRLSSATDALNKKIATFETSLTRLGLGVLARVNLYAEENGDMTWLYFMKWGDSWRLVVNESNELSGQEGDDQLLQNCTRQYRLHAVTKFPDLVAALVAAAESEIVRVQEAEAQVDEVVTAITESKS